MWKFHFIYRTEQIEFEIGFGWFVVFAYLAWCWWS